MENEKLLVRQRKPKLSRMARREAIWGYSFIAPGTIGVIVFTLVPLVFSIVMSFTDWSLLSKPHFLGLENYAELFTDSTVAKEFRNRKSRNW